MALNTLHQRSPTSLVPGTGFMEANFSMDWGRGWGGGSGWRWFLIGPDRYRFAAPRLRTLAVYHPGTQLGGHSPLIAACSLWGRGESSHRPPLSHPEFKLEPRGPADTNFFCNNIRETLSWGEGWRKEKVRAFIPYELEEQKHSDSLQTRPLCTSFEIGTTEWYFRPLFSPLKAFLSWRF